MMETLRLIVAMAAGLLIFGFTMLVYAVGIATGLCTYSGQLIATVAIESIAVSTVIWIFYD